MTHIIVGMGEVGTALKAIFPEASTMDQEGRLERIHYDVAHICFPYSDLFLTQVAQYKDSLSPRLLIVHSSVPVGTSDQLGAVYSPIRGVHPNLVEGIRTFTKYFAGSQAYEAAALFEEKGIYCQVIADSRSLEAAKLWDTAAYGMMILLEKEIWEYCQKNSVQFDLVYRDFTKTYNEGYEKLGMSHVVRPYLMHYPGKIGGHCILENAALLGSPSAELLIKENEKL